MALVQAEAVCRALPICDAHLLRGLGIISASHGPVIDHMQTQHYERQTFSLPVHILQAANHGRALITEVQSQGISAARSPDPKCRLSNG